MIHLYNFEKNKKLNKLASALSSVFIAATISGASLLPNAYAAAHNVDLLNDNNGWKLQVDGKDFFVKGVVWGYTPRDENYSYNLWGQDEAFIKDVLDYDFSRMQAAGINAIRTFMMIPPKWVEYVYKKYGIMTAVNPLMGRYGATVNGQWIENTDYSDPATREALKQEVLQVVRDFKDTPGVLMFALGNESNYGLSWKSFEIENLPVGEQNQAKAGYLYSLFDEVIDAGREIAPEIPFTIVNGDIQYLDLIAKNGDDWDLLGVNAYRGKSFTGLWQDVKTKYGKPVLFFEFGSDAFNAKEFREDERAQAEYLKAQWEEMYRKAYGNGEEGNAIGGFVFEWRDEWWKYKQTENLNTHDKNASWSNGGYKFDFQENANNMNEEWWGINRLGKANSDGVYEAETRLALDVLSKIWAQNPYDLPKAQSSIAALDMDAMAEYRAQNSERSDRIFGTEAFKMTGGRVIAERINRGDGERLELNGDGQGWSHETGVMAFADFEFEPNANFRGNFTLNYIADNANSLLYPERYGNRLNETDGKKFEVYDFEATISEENFDLNMFYHTPRYHWGYEGDFFGLVHEVTDMTGPNGQDIWNAKAPSGVEFEGKGILDGLTILAGKQVYWGANPKAIIRYRFGDNKQYSIMHSQDTGQASDTDGSEVVSRKSTQTTIQGSFDLGKNRKLELGAISSGRDKIGESFEYVKDGRVEAQDIDASDTVGVKGKYSFPLNSKAKAYIAGQYAGLVADAGAPLVEFDTRLPYSGLGNKMVAEAGVQYTDGNFTWFPRVMVRDNLMAANTGSGIFGRNTADDPFAVLGNRKVRAAELMLTYDPTPATPFYAWDNDVREDAKLAFNVALTVMDYGWATDAHRIYAGDIEDELVFDGLEADTLWIASSKVVVNPTPGYKAVIRVDHGKQQPGGANDVGIVKNTEFTSIDAKVILNSRHVVNVFAAKDKWGPYDYERAFGVVYKEQANLSYSFLLDKGVREENSSKLGIKLMHRKENERSDSKSSEVQTFVEYHF